MGYLDELFGEYARDDEEEEARALVPDVDFSALGQGSPYTSPRPVGTTPRAPLDLPSLPYGQQERAGPDPALAMPRLPPELARRPMALPRPPYERPEPVDAVSSADAPREEPASMDFSVDEAEAAQEQFGGDRPAATGIERVFQQGRGAKPGRPISSLGPKPDDLGDAQRASDRNSNWARLGGGIARMLGADQDDVDAVVEQAGSRPMERYSEREAQRRYGVQQDAARREEASAAGREQRLGQERTRQLDLEDRRLTQQSEAQAAARGDRQASQAALEQYRQDRLALQQRALDLRGRRHGGAGSTAPGAPGEAGAMVDDPSAWRAFWMAQGHSQEQADRSWGLMPRRQDRIDAIQGAMGPGAERQERLRQRQGTRGELGRILSDVEASIDAGAPGLGGPLNAQVGGPTGEWARGLVQGDEAQVARARLADLANIINHRSFGANFTRSEQARAALAGLDAGSPLPVIRDRLARLRAILDEEEADVGGDETHAPTAPREEPRTPRAPAPAAAEAPQAGTVRVESGGRSRDMTAEDYTRFTTWADRQNPRVPYRVVR